MNINEFPQHIQELHQHGEKSLNTVLKILADWPRGEYSQRIAFDMRTEADKKSIRRALGEFKRWAKALGVQRAHHDSRKLDELVDTVTFALLKEDFKRNAIDDAERVRKEALSLVTSMPISRRASGANIASQRPKTQKGTAFIIMAMGELPELQDTCLTIKRVCKSHGFRAFRADDIQHSGIVFNEIFDSITSAELLIGDLTFQMPNVYCELGIALGQAKKPILVRKYGTKLDFDLAAHNVPQYRNFAELESLLGNRLKALRDCRN